MPAVQTAANVVDAAKPIEKAEHSEVKVEVNQLVKRGLINEDLQDEFVCKICMVNVVSNGPKMTKCAHLFCGDCIAEWFRVHPTSLSWAQRASAQGKVPCPVCKEPLNEKKDLYPVCAEGPAQSAFLWQMISGLQVNCSNHPSCQPCGGQCNWKGSYSAFLEHIKACKNEPIFDDSASTVAVSSSCGDATEDDSLSTGHTETEKSEDAFDEVVAPDEAEEMPLPDSAEESNSEAVCQAEVSSDSEARQPSEPCISGETASLTDLIQQWMQLKEQEHNDKQPVAEEPAAEEPAAAVQEGSSALHAVKAFIAGDSSQISIEVGDALEIVQQHASGWTYGRKAHELSSEGWFPQWVLESQ